MPHINKWFVPSAVLLIFAVNKASGGPRWKNRLIPPGFELVDGEAIDITDKVVQMASSKGTEYYAFDDPRGKAIYIRDGYERGFHFIVFDDPYNQDPGGGHFVVLQRMTGLSADSSGKVIYEAFLLSLEDSIGADVEPYDAQETDYYRDEDLVNRARDARLIAT